MRKTRKRITSLIVYTESNRIAHNKNCSKPEECIAILIQKEVERENKRRRKKVNKIRTYYE